MRVRVRALPLWGALLVCLRLSAQMAPKGPGAEARGEAAGDDPLAIVEVGAATSWNTAGGTATFAPNLAAEVTPIEHWLELEAGVSPFWTRRSTEWDVDFLFKKPWTISNRAEFMFGVGPGWAWVRQNGRSANVFSGEAAGDFMFWPTGRHRVGWFLEPAFEYAFAAGHQRSVGMTAGLLIGVGRGRRE